MIFKDYYKILGLDTNKVSIDDIKIAFREQAKIYHPDVNVGKNTEERFKDINEAYRVLSDNAARKKYDRSWNAKIGRKKAKKEAASRPKTSAAEEVKNILFGTKESKESKINKKAAKVPIQGENIETEIEVSIEDAFYGKTKRISLRTVQGKMKNFDIKIPEGIRNGEKIRLMGQGAQGKNGGKNGDLLIKIVIKNSKDYKLIGSDIHKIIFVSPWEAVLGAKVEEKVIDEPFSVYIPKGIQTGEYIRISGKGYKDGKGSRGDLVLEVNIMIQKNITEEEKELYKKLKNISKFNPRKAYN